MKKRSESAGDRGLDASSDGFNVDELLGLGSHSARKSYYPALLDRIGDLNDERSRYKWLFDNALHGIFQAGLRGGLISCNPALAQMCGYDSPSSLTHAIVRLREQLFCSVHDYDNDGQSRRPQSCGHRLGQVQRERLAAVSIGRIQSRDIQHRQEVTQRIKNWRRGAGQAAVRRIEMVNPMARHLLHGMESVHHLS